MSDSVLTEEVHDSFGVFEQRWTCTPPDKGACYEVVRQTWSDDYRVRTIHEWRAV